jgi:hypothetical protein
VVRWRNESEGERVETGMVVFKDKIQNERHLTSSFALTWFGMKIGVVDFPSCD